MGRRSPKKCFWSKNKGGGGTRAPPLNLPLEMTDFPTLSCSRSLKKEPLSGGTFPYRLSLGVPPPPPRDPLHFLCIKRLNRLNTFKEHESTSTWFGRTEQHDRGHVTPNKFPGLHNGCLYTRLLCKTKELLRFTVLSQIFVCEGLSKISSKFTLHLIKVGTLKQFKTVSSDL